MLLRDLSLRRKVPLYIGAGLFVVISAWTWVAYRNVQQAALQVGEERLSGVTATFATMYDSAARAYARSMQTAAANREFVNFVGGHGSAMTDSLRKLLKRFTQGANHRVTLFALDGTPLASYPDTQKSALTERHEELATEFATLAKGPTYAAVAPLRMLDDSVVIPIVATILRDSQPAGFLVLWRRVAATAQARDQAAKLIGANAQVYLGNRRGDLWADMGGNVQKFPTPIPDSGGVVQYTRADTTPVLAAARQIAGTPWEVAIDFADSAVMAPADSFLRQSVIVGVVVLVVATLTAGFLSRRITNPLHDLTVAATAMAGGDYSRRIAVGRKDELGRLSESFNVMAAQVGVAHDALEAKVQQRTVQIQQRNEDLESFAHSMSHDLRAPLRAMHGFSQALLEDCGDQLDDTGKDYAQRIAKAALRMDLLTQDLLAYSQVSRGDVALTPVDLGAAAHSAVTQLEADIAGKDAKVSVQDPLPTALGHRPSVEQAVANLVANGLKFVPEGRAPDITVRAEQRDGWVRLWVEDNGIGIDPAYHQRIFSVFERLHQPEQFAGTGIGLAIVRKAVDRMGGRTGVVSALGAGSRFWIELRGVEAQQA